MPDIYRERVSVRHAREDGAECSLRDVEMLRTCYLMNAISK